MNDLAQAAAVRSEQQRYPKEFEKARNRPWTPVLLKTDQPEGFVAPDRFYVVYCNDCDTYLVQHPAGREGKIRCRGCRGFVKTEGVPTWLLVLAALSLLAIAAAVAIAGVILLIELAKRAF